MSEQKNFVNFHVLISHSPSCLNRDDQNMQKRAVFGGVERIRISSQSLKRSMRRPEENTYDYWKKVFGDPSTRTRDPGKVATLFFNQLNGEYSQSVVSRAAQLFVNKGTEDEEDDDSEATNVDLTLAPEPAKKIAVAPWVLAEIREICRIVQSVELSEEEVAKVKEKSAKQKGKKQKSEGELLELALVAKIKKGLDQKKGAFESALATAMDVALWGRMATSGLMTSIDGSLAVAHAITTHAAQTETDWFTAVDDLVSQGTGHLDTQEFSSGVFYRYASLNISQLQKNLGGATRDRALEIAKHVFHMLCTVVPAAKQQSFAAHNPADFAIVTFDDQPISLANAFEKPVPADKAGGYLQPSINALIAYFHRMRDVYSLGTDNVAMPEILFSDPKTRPDLNLVKSLQEAEDWIALNHKSAS